VTPTSPPSGRLPRAHDRFHDLSAVRADDSYGEYSDGRVSRTPRRTSCRRHLHRRCCAGDGGLLALRRRPSGEGVKPPDAALAEDRRGERSGEGAVERVRWGPGRRSRKRPVRGFSGWVCAVEASLEKLRWHQKRGVWLFSRDELGGCPDDWPGGARREGGVSLVCGSGTEREKASVGSGRPALRGSSTGGERERADGGNRRH
jgi:hypothetical protein